MLTREDYLQLYFNTEVARRANIREDRKLTQEQERLRKCYNLALLKQEMDFQAEKSKQLDLEEMKMAAETAEEEKEQERRNARNGAHGISKAYSEYTTSTNMNSEDKKSIGTSWTAKQTKRAGWATAKSSRSLRLIGRKEWRL